MMVREGEVLAEQASGGFEAEFDTEGLGGVEPIEGLLIFKFQDGKSKVCGGLEETILDSLFPGAIDGDGESLGLHVDEESRAIGRETGAGEFCCARGVSSDVVDLAFLGDSSDVRLFSSVLLNEVFANDEVTPWCGT